MDAQYLLGKCTVIKAFFPFNSPRSKKFNMMSLISPPLHNRMKTETVKKMVRRNGCYVLHEYWKGPIRFAILPEC